MIGIEEHSALNILLAPTPGHHSPIEMTLQMDLAFKVARP